MRTPSRLALGTLIALAVTPSMAAAQDDHTDPATFTPSGYAFCGWLDFSANSWRMTWDEYALSGAFVRVFARRMSCSSARRNYRGLRTRPTPPYPTTRVGYRCRVLAKGYESSDLRCTKRGQPRTAFRVQSGA